MPPRKSTRGAAAGQTTAAAVRDAASTETAVSIAAMSDALSTSSAQVESACADWAGEGRATVSSIIDNQLSTLIRHRDDEAAASAPAVLPDIVLSKTLSIVLRQASEVSVEQLADLYKGLIDDKEGDAKSEYTTALGEIITDLVEVLLEEQEDVEGFAKERREAGPRPVTEESKEMEVDGQAQQSSTAAERGLDLIKRMLDSNHLPSYIPTLILSTERLLPLGLHPIPHHPDSLRMQYVKRSTNLFFKQSKYNLLRESSEGFSRLIVLLLGPDAIPSTSVTRQEGEEERRRRAKGMWSKIMGLIGYFSLSPPRVLDLVLEIASFNVAEHWQFWLELLKCSPWGSTAKSSKGKERMWDESTEGIERALSGQGDRVLAQVLGVKFGFFQSSDSGDTPIGLIYMAALLLKHGFIAFADLLPFMTPDDVAMDKLYNEYIDARGTSGPRNALTMSVLVDDDDAGASNSAAEAATTANKAAPEQRIQLLQALLAIGHMPAALYLLGKAPWLAQYYPSIGDLIIRIVERNIEPLYRAHQREWADAVKGDDDAEEVERGLLLEEPAVHYRPKEKKLVKSLLSPTPADTPDTRFEFFYPDWAAGMDQWEAVQDVYEKGLKWLDLVKGLGGRHAEVMIKICRIGHIHFLRLRKHKEDTILGKRAASRADARAVEPTEAEMKPWLDLIRVSLLPSLSVSNASAAFDIEIWRMLKLFPYVTRYSLYGEWRDFTTVPRAGTGKLSCLIAASAATNATRAVKQALQRVTAQKVVTAADNSQKVVQDRGPARTLAKLCHSNPCQLWSTVVFQVKSYANIGSSIIDAGRYMTQLSYDVANFTILDTLSADTASRLNNNGTGIADWLQHLAVFAGDFNRRYNSMDLEPLLQFIMNRLLRGQSDDLAILDSLITSMTGALQYDNDAISALQLEAHLGGPQLLHEMFETTQFTIVNPAPLGEERPAPAPQIDNSKMWKKSLPRLLRVLRETGMTMPILLGLAQTSQRSMDTMAHAPIKAMSLIQDSCHSLFIRFGDLLREHFSNAEHIANTPDLFDLVEGFGLDFAQAFQILRPKLAARMLQNSQTAAVAARAALPQGEADSAEQHQVDGQPTSEDVAFWPAVFQTTIDQARTLLPASDSELMTAPFFVTFWQLSLADIGYPGDMYETNISRIMTMSDPMKMRRSHPAVTDVVRFEESRRLKARNDLLIKERNRLLRRYKETKKRLELESKSWFPSDISANKLRTRLCQQLHQHCFYPRAIQTPGDALFVPKLIRFMHDIGTPHFTTLFAYSDFVQAGLAANIFSCTENEARNLGRCIAAIMSQLDRWHADEAVYRREATGEVDDTNGPAAVQKDSKEGKEVDKAAKNAAGEESSQKVVKAPLPGMMVTTKSSTKQVPMSWSQFRGYYAARFHTPLCNALVSCWKESEFMHVKNAITIGLQVMPSFPMMLDHDAQVQKSINDLIAKKGHEAMTDDVKLQCKTFLTQLQARQKKVPCVDPPEFFSAGKSVLKPVAQARPVPNAESTEEPAVESASTGVVAKANGESASTTAGDSKTTANGSAAPADAQAAADRAAALRAKLASARAESSRKGAPGDNAAGEAGRSASTPDVDVKTEDKSAAPPSGPRGGATSSPATPEVKEPPSGPAKKDAPTGPSGKAGMGPPAPDKPLSVADQRAAEDARRFAALAKDLPPAGPVASAASAAGASGPHAKAESSTPVKAPTGPKGANATTSVDIKPEAKAAAIPVERVATSSRRSSPGAKDAPRRRSRSVESKVSERSRRDRRDRDDRPRDRERDRERDRDRDRERSRRDGGRDGDRDRERERDRDRKVSDPRASDRDGRRENGGSRTPSIRGDDDRRKGEELLPPPDADRRRSLRADSKDRKDTREDRERERDRPKEDERDARRRRGDERDRTSRNGARRDDPERRDERDHDRHVRPGRDDRDRDAGRDRGRHDEPTRRDERDQRDGSSRRELLPDPAPSARQRDPPPHASSRDRDARPRSPARSDRAPPGRTESIAKDETTKHRETTPLAARIQPRVETEKERIGTNGTPARPHGLPVRPDASTPARSRSRDRLQEKEKEKERNAPAASNASLPERPSASSSAPAPAPLGGSLAARLGIRSTSDNRPDDGQNGRDRERDRERNDRDVDRGRDSRGGRDERDARGDRDDRDVRDGRGARDDRDNRDARGGRDERGARDRRDERDRERDRDRDRERERDRYHESGRDRQRGGPVPEAGESRRDEEERDRERKRPHDAVADAAAVSREGSPADAIKRVRIDRNRARRDGGSGSGSASGTGGGGGSRMFGSALRSAGDGGR